MKKLLGVVVLGLLLSGNTYGEIIEFKECWAKKTVSLNHKFEKTEINYSDNLYFKEISKIEFQNFSINSATNSLIRTIKYSKNDELFPDKLDQVSIQIESWDNQYLKAYKNEILSNGVSHEQTFIMNMDSGEIQYTERITESSNNHFYMQNDKNIICDKLPTYNNGEKNILSGTAFFINSNGFLLTNNHVISECKTNSNILLNGKNIEVNLIAKDPNLDLAILKANVTPNNFLKFSSDRPEKLQKIIVAGYPFGKGLSDDLKFTQGIISSLKGFEDNSNELQIDAAINPGNSGGPIVDEKSNLVAIAVSGLSKEVAEGINFGIKSSSVMNFLDVNSIKYSYSKTSDKNVGNKKLSKILEEATVYTYCN